MLMSRFLLSGVMLMTRRLVGSIVAILFLWGASSFALQDKISPLSDFQYNKDLKQFDEIKKEADIQKRADLLLAFSKEHPINRILSYIAAEYQEAIKPNLQKKDWAKAIAMVEAFTAVLPTDQMITDAQIPVGVEEFQKQQLQPTKLQFQKLLLAIYGESNNLPKAAEMQEAIYAAAPDAEGLQRLAGIYLAMQNYDKYLPLAQKIMAANPMDQPLGYGTALQMAQIYLQKQDVATATDLLTKVLDVYGDKVPPNVPEAQWNATRAFAFGVLAQGVYAKKDYVKALELYGKVIKFDNKRDDAYYSIGMSKWQTKDQAGAIDAFAKCVALNKPATSAKARNYLEQLYKPTHNNTLDGLDAVLAKAKTDLGI
jgi:tetratricopeptide (TPR) repeat protein